MRLCQDRTEGEGEVTSKMGDLKYVETEIAICLAIAD